jgi:hypothetical protein
VRHQRTVDPADAFHLVIPSIPGFGFSGPTRDTGCTTRRIADAFAGHHGLNECRNRYLGRCRVLTPPGFRPAR